MSFGNLPVIRETPVYRLPWLRLSSFCLQRLVFVSVIATLVVATMGVPSTQAQVANGPCWCRVIQSDNPFTTGSARATTDLNSVIFDVTPECLVQVEEAYPTVDGARKSWILDNPEGDHMAGVECVGRQCIINENGVVACGFGTGPQVFASPAVPFTVDKTPPVMTVSAPIEGAVLLRSTVTFSGTVTETAALSFAYMRREGVSKVVTIPNGAWEFKLATGTLELGAAQLGTHFITANFSAGDMAGNYTTYNCGSDNSPLCRQNTSLARHFTLDGTAPAVGISTPANISSISTLPTISGTARDDVMLKETTLMIRNNATGKFWNGVAFAAGEFQIKFDPSQMEMHDRSSSTWRYNELKDEHLVNLTSYTVIARSEDSVGLFSEIAYSTFTFDLCAPDPIFPSDQRATVSGRLLDIKDYLEGCSVALCSRRAAISPNPGFYEMTDVTPPQIRSGPRVVCDDQERQCPIPGGLSRNDDCGDGIFGASRTDGGSHGGSDMQRPFGTGSLVLSATRGTVIFVGQAGKGDINFGSKPSNELPREQKLGWIIVVRSSRTLAGPYPFEYTIYAHLKPPDPGGALSNRLAGGGGIVGEGVTFAPLLVRPGQIVYPGSPIGEYDRSGNSNSISCPNSDFLEHVHVALYHSKQPVSVTPNNAPVVNEKKIKKIGSREVAEDTKRFDMTPFLKNALNSGVAKKLDPDAVFGCYFYGKASLGP